MLPASVRPLAAAILSVCATVTLLLGARYAGRSEAGWLDAALASRIHAHLDGRAWPLAAVHLGDPLPVAVASALLVLTCLRLRGWRATLLVLIAVPSAGGLTELLLKPLFHRTYLGGLAYPSGHATAVWVIVVVLAVLLVDPPRPRPGARWRALLAAAALGLAGLSCVALVGTRSHYATDTVGGAAVATAVVLFTALLLDLVPARPAPPAAQPSAPPEQHPPQVNAG